METSNNKILITGGASGSGLGLTERFVKENNTVLAVANRYGEEVPNDFGHGGICIIQKDGTVNCEGLVWDQDCIVLAEV